MLLVFWLIFLASCDLPERPETVIISTTPTFRPSTPNEIHTLEEAFAAIITVCEDLGLPRVDQLSVHLYKNTASFAYHGRGWTTLPVDVAGVVASARGKEMHINLEATAGHRWGELIEVLGHEYAHNVANFMGHRGSGLELWVVEGFASWVASKILHQLGWKDYATSLEAAHRELTRFRTILPPLTWLRDQQIWKSELQKPFGSVRTYTLAFFATHRIIEERGLAAVLKYLRAGDFEMNFAASPQLFAIAIEKYLTKIEPAKHAAFVIHKPDWRLHEQWVYDERGPYGSGKLINRFVKEEPYEGVIAAVVESNNRYREERLYSKDTLALLVTKRDGKIIFRRDRPHQYFHWPLEIGKEWRNTYRLENLVERQTSVVDDIVVVSSQENVRVPAGSFDTVKIEMYDYHTGRLQAEYWYSATIKWFAKLRFYEAAGVREQQLVSFGEAPSIER